MVDCGGRIGRIEARYGGWVKARYMEGMYSKDEVKNFGRSVELRQRQRNKIKAVRKVGLS
jgi:hypothetical protein